MNIQTAMPNWKSVTLEQTMKRDRENGSPVGPDRQVTYISSNYKIVTRTIPGSTRYEETVKDVWQRDYPAAGDAVVDLRQEGWQGVKRTSIGLGVGAVAGSLISMMIDPSSTALVAGALIGGAVGIGIGFHKSDGFLGLGRDDDFRAKTPLQAFTLAKDVERLAQQIAAPQA